MAERKRPNAEIRAWYLSVLSLIPKLNQEWLAAGITLRDRAFVAWSIRHIARLEARDMMVDPAEVENLRARDLSVHGNPDGPTFADLVEQGYRAGLEESAIYEAIIEKSSRPNPGINERFGL